jgi:hypothetical protein
VDREFIWRNGLIPLMPQRPHYVEPLELRATTALAHLRGRGANGRQARAKLAELLDSFTEGFDTADLKDARRLLARR